MDDWVEVKVREPLYSSIMSIMNIISCSEADMEINSDGKIAKVVVVKW